MNKVVDKFLLFAFLVLIMDFDHLVAFFVDCFVVASAVDTEIDFAYFVVDFENVDFVVDFEIVDFVVDIVDDSGLFVEDSVEIVELDSDLFVEDFVVDKVDLDFAVVLVEIDYFEIVVVELDQNFDIVVAAVAVAFA